MNAGRECKHGGDKAGTAEEAEIGSPTVVRRQVAHGSRGEDNCGKRVYTTPREAQERSGPGPPEPDTLAPLAADSVSLIRRNAT